MNFEFLFFGKVVPAVIIIAFVVVLTYLLFFKTKEKTIRDKKEVFAPYNAHSTDTSPLAIDVFKSLEEHEISLNYLHKEIGG